MKIILASASPRRRELLKEIFHDYTVEIPICDEKASGSPDEYVSSIAIQKAKAIQTTADIIISADTIVVFDDKILGKPKNEQDAIKMLNCLSGKRHYVYTGVCIKHLINNEYSYEVFYDKSSVFMRKLSQKQIHDYVKTGSPLDKAGSYGIQDGVVEKYIGSYSNIVGLPVEKLKQKLIDLNLI